MDFKLCFRRSLMVAGLGFSLLLAGCAPTGLYYWGNYEPSLVERYVENSHQHTDAYLTQTLLEAEQHHRKVAPGVYADYGFLLYTRGDNAGAIANFQKERALYPESLALMNKLIERIQQKETQAKSASEEASWSRTDGEPK